MSDRFIDISVTGDKQLQKDLAALEFKLQRKIVRGAARKAMKPVKDRAAALAPKKTGKMAKSLRVTSKTRKGISRIRVQTGTRELLGVDPNAPGYYPAAVEFGYTTTSGRNIPARSFLRRALGELRPQVFRELATAIHLAIRREYRK